MSLFSRIPGSENVLLIALCILVLLEFFASVTVLALLCRQRRFRWLWLVFPMIIFSYIVEQCLLMYRYGVDSEIVAQIIRDFATIPDWLLIGLSLVIALGDVLLMRNIHLYEKKHITSMSVKEAVDSLPSGILCYVPGVRTLLINQTMRDFCRNVTGEELISGEVFVKKLYSGELLPECKTEFVGNEPVFVPPDGRAWRISEGEVPYEKASVQILLVSEITEVYQKTLELKAMWKKIEAMGTRLHKVNREIVALTTEREILNAKIKLHDELGSNLLAIKYFIRNGGAEKEKAELMESLRHSVAFLKSDRKKTERDEYELMIGTAKRIGLTVSVTWTLPDTEPHKHILAAAIHECGTNTLRHARGDRLTIEVTEDETHILAKFTNNGEQPAGEIAERGGLLFLRTLTEQAGGEMTLTSVPVFILRLKLPKEVEDAI